MENRNVIIAVILSTAILIGWSMYFENPDEAQRKRLEIQGKTETQTNIQKPETPQTTKANPTKAISRGEALKEGDRVSIENSNLAGSISLRGAIIDDIVLNEVKSYPSPKYKKSIPTFLSINQISQVLEHINKNEKLSYCKIKTN